MASVRSHDVHRLVEDAPLTDRLGVQHHTLQVSGVAKEGGNKRTARGPVGYSMVQ